MRRCLGRGDARRRARTGGPGRRVWQESAPTRCWRHPARRVDAAVRGSLYGARDLWTHAKATVRESSGGSLLHKHPRKCERLACLAAKFKLEQCVPLGDSKPRSLSTSRRLSHRWKNSGADLSKYHRVLLPFATWLSRVRRGRPPGRHNSWRRTRISPVARVPLVSRRHFSFLPEVGSAKLSRRPSRFLTDVRAHIHRRASPCRSPSRSAPAPPRSAAPWPRKVSHDTSFRALKRGLLDAQGPRVRRRPAGLAGTPRRDREAKHRLFLVLAPERAPSRRDRVTEPREPRTSASRFPRRRRRTARRAGPARAGSRGPTADRSSPPPPFQTTVLVPAELSRSTHHRMPPTSDWKKRV